MAPARLEPVDHLLQRQRYAGGAEHLDCFHVLRVARFAFGRAGDDRNKVVALAEDAYRTARERALQSLGHVLAADAKATRARFGIERVDDRHLLAPVILHEDGRFVLGEHFLGLLRQALQNHRVGPGKLRLDLRAATRPQFEQPDLGARFGGVLLQIGMHICLQPLERRGVLNPQDHLAEGGCRRLGLIDQLVAQGARANDGLNVGNAVHLRQILLNLFQIAAGALDIGARGQPVIDQQMRRCGGREEALFHEREAHKGDGEQPPGQAHGTPAMAQRAREPFAIGGADPAGFALRGGLVLETVVACIESCLPISAGSGSILLLLEQPVGEKRRYGDREEPREQERDHHHPEQVIGVFGDLPGGEADRGEGDDADQRAS